MIDIEHPQVVQKNAGEVEEGELVLMTPSHQCFLASPKGCHIAIHLIQSPQAFLCCNYVVTVVSNNTTYIFIIF